MPDQPDQKQQKPALSPSRVSLYQTCGYAFYRRYILNDRRQPGRFLHQGKAVHAAAEWNFTQKIESHEDLPAKEIVDMAASKFQESVEMDGFGLTPNEQSKGHKATVGEVLDDTVTLARVHAEQQAPEYQPAAVEYRVFMELPTCSHDLLGFVDIVDETWQVRDFKTATRKKNQKDADTSFQLQFYDMGIAVTTGKRPKDVGLDVAIKTKSGKTSRQLLICEPTESDFNAMINRASAVIHGIDNEVFLPAEPGSWKCSAKWCEYAATDDCPYYVPERDPEHPKYSGGQV